MRFNDAKYMSNSSTYIQSTIPILHSKYVSWNRIAMEEADLKHVAMSGMFN
jgi:hypothetical protein